MTEDTKLTTTGKALIGAGALALASGMLGGGKLLANGIVKKKQAEMILNEGKKAVDIFKPKIKFWKESKIPVLKDVMLLVRKNQMEGKFYDAVEKAVSKEDEIRKGLSPFIKNLDRNSVLAGSGSAFVGSKLTEKKAEVKLQIGATKESEEKAKHHIRPDLLREPVHYTRGFQSGPIIENASKMDKIAEAVNSLFPKDYKDIELAQQQKQLGKQEKAIMKRDEALAMHEQAHQEKDIKLKELQKAIKQVNSKAEHYRAKAIEHFTNHLDSEADAI